jgi:hypothetical protein
MVLEAALRAQRRKLGANHADTTCTRNRLAATYERVGRPKNAVPLYEESVKFREAALGPDDPEILRYKTRLADAYESLGHWTEGETLRRDSLASRGRIDKDSSPRLAADLMQFGSNLIRQEKWAEAEPLLRECVAIQENVESDDWRTFNVRSMLGASLLGQGRCADAESLIVAGLDGMRIRSATIPPEHRLKTRAATDRVILLYESWGKNAKTDASKTKLGLRDLPANVLARP